MVERVVNRPERGTDVREVADPSVRLPDVALHVEAHLERVTVQAAALVVSSDVWQPMRCLEPELAEDLHLHPRCVAAHYLSGCRSACASGG